MSRHVPSIANRLSLRHPQRRSLEILDEVMAQAAPHKGRATADVLAAIRAIPNVPPSFQEFERAFPNVCFALATGVGKTRLMGAFIAYLHAEHGVRNFFVVAPNLTIYNKLIADFTPNTPKYVFQGIADFAVRPPALITGDDFEAAVPRLGLEEAGQGTMLDSPVRINIFNVAKIAMGTKQKDSKALARVRRLSEYLGQSYFDYLAGQKDLVVIMDEAHRYRADASMQAIEDLRPMLGLELTATPQVESGGKAVRFKNVIFDYPLATAMKDGFVKEPAVATRVDFSAAGMTPPQLERLKLEDGIRVHEESKVALQTDAINAGKARVKPFVLVVARDTTHADDLVKLIQEPQFFDGRYAGKVIQVHSGQSGSEKDDVVQQLLTVERPDNPVEIVVHVNMLKEGWDVTNLYTIIPLRAADSKTLVEQSIGRGLRLPYGKRVGVPAVDRLTIVAHDRFQDIVDEARKGGFTFTEIRIGKEVGEKPQQSVVVASTLDHLIGAVVPSPAALPGAAPSGATPVPAPKPRPQFTTPGQQAAAKATVTAIQGQAQSILKALGKGATPIAMRDPEVQAKLVEVVRADVEAKQVSLPGYEIQEEIASLVYAATELWIDNMIAVPRIVVLPVGGVQSGFRRFDVDLRSVRLNPVSDEILIQHLASDHRERLGALAGGHEEARLEDYVVRCLLDYDDVSYDDQADVLYDLAGQVVAHLRSYLKSDDDVRNVLLFHQRRLGDLLHAQMREHVWEEATAYEVQVNPGFAELRTQAYNAPAGAVPRDFRKPVDNKLDIRNMLFNGFERCLYPMVKFDSDSERRFACVLEADTAVQKWSKPGKGVFQIRYTQDDSYEPDFVVETETEKLLCEPKRADQMQDKVVLAKAKAAAVWCARAAVFERENGGKPWRYVLIPHDAITENMTLAGLAKTYTVSAENTA